MVCIILECWSSQSCHILLIIVCQPQSMSFMCKVTAINDFLFLVSFIPIYGVGQLCCGMEARAP